MTDLSPITGNVVPVGSYRDALKRSGLQTEMPLVIDSFAGGGGASTGIEDALEFLRASGVLPAHAPVQVDYAVNHDPKALAMHEANHPNTVHLPHDVWKVSMKDLVGDRPIGLLWASPDCTHHSRAKGGTPLSKEIRDLAWVIVRWLKEVDENQLPQTIFLENVPEFRDWGPLIYDKKKKRMVPDKALKGTIFNEWIAAIEALGYKVEWRILKASEYGAPTIRTRLYLIARRDGDPIVWPAPTHGDPKSEAVKAGLLKPWPVTAEIIDWDIPTPTIFMSKEESQSFFKKTRIQVRRPLSDKTLLRIAKGIVKYVLDMEKMYLVECNAGVHRGSVMTELYGRSSARRVDAPLSTVTGKGTHALASAELARLDKAREGTRRAMYIRRDFGQSVGHALTDPSATITPDGQGHSALISAFLAQNNTGLIGRGADQPLSTILGKGCTQSLVAANLISLKGNDRRDIDTHAPHPTVCASGQHSMLVNSAVHNASAELTLDQMERAWAIADFLRSFGLWDEREMVTVGPYVLVDIGVRMLSARELARAQGFGDDYILDAPFTEEKMTKKGKKRTTKTLTDTDQRHKIGNSVCRHVAAALVAANYRPTPVARMDGGNLAVAA